MAERAKRTVVKAENYNGLDIYVLSHKVGGDAEPGTVRASVALPTKKTGPGVSSLVFGGDDRHDK